MSKGMGISQRQPSMA